MKTFGPFVIAAVVLLTLAGCSVHANLTVTASEVVGRAAIDNASGARPTIDTTIGDSPIE